MDVQYTYNNTIPARLTCALLSTGTAISSMCISLISFSFYFLFFDKNAFIIPYFYNQRKREGMLKNEKQRKLLVLCRFYNLQLLWISNARKTNTERCARSLIKKSSFTAIRGKRNFRRVMGVYRVFYIL